MKEALSTVLPNIVILSAAVEECPKAFIGAVGGFPKPILPSIVRGLMSPLLADMLVVIFRNLRHSAFDEKEEESLSLAVSAVTLQVIGPASKKFMLDNRIGNNTEALKCCLRDVVQRLHQSSVQQKPGRGLLQESDYDTLEAEA